MDKTNRQKQIKIFRETVELQCSLSVKLLKRTRQNAILFSGDGWEICQILAKLFSWKFKTLKCLILKHTATLRKSWKSFFTATLNQIVQIYLSKISPQWMLILPSERDLWGQFLQHWQWPLSPFLAFAG